jgi:hypothetical protein
MSVAKPFNRHHDRALISQLLTDLFGITFFVVAMTIKWLAPLVDAYVKGGAGISVKQ